MIHNDIQNQLQLLIKGTSQPLIDVAEHPVETPQWTPGQKLPAHVLASLPNGRFQVQIENQILDMNLPSNTQPGVTLELIYAGNSPRLTFVLPREQGVASKSLSASGGTAKPGVALNTTVVSSTAATLGQAPESSDKLGANHPDTPVVLSNLGKFIDSLQQKTGQSKTASAPFMPVAADKSAPVLNMPPEQGKLLAEALSKTLSQSGLFYESHQLQWISGERSLNMLRQEPQARFSPVIPGKAETAPVIQNQHFPELRFIDSPQASTAISVAPPASDKAAVAVNAQTLPMVQQQLDVLDTRQVVWQGQVWPGQEMHWEIEEDGHGQRGEQDVPTGWNTRLRLNLPKLGGVTANIALRPEGIRVDFSVSNNDSAALLKNEQPGLIKSFDAAGLNLTLVTVNQNGQTSQTNQV